MSDEIEGLKAFIRSWLTADFERIPSSRHGSRGVHLEVWRARRRGAPAGLEMDHFSLVNIWVRTTDGVPSMLPSSVRRTDKTPAGRGWTDRDGRGANHNLKAFGEFRGHAITRLAIRSKDEARLVLEHLAL